MDVAVLCAPGRRWVYFVVVGVCARSWCLFLRGCCLLLRSLAEAVEEAGDCGLAGSFELVDGFLSFLLCLLSVLFESVVVFDGVADVPYGECYDGE